MDPTAPPLTEAAKQGFAVLLLLMAVYGLVRWLSGAFKQIRDDANENRKECLDREKKMADRLSAVEDRQFTECARVLERSAAALEMNARTFQKLLDSDSGLRRALDRKLDRNHHQNHEGTNV